MQTSSLSIIRHSSPFLRRTAIYHGGFEFVTGAGAVAGVGIVIGIRRGVFLLSARRENPNVSRKPQPSKNILRAKDIGKDYSSLAPILSLDQKPSLLDSQAIGTVSTAQANFMRVIVHGGTDSEQNKDGGGGISVDGGNGISVDGGRGNSVDGGNGISDHLSKTDVELLCVVRAVLKKIRRRVLVGDKVLVGSIDWVDRRGMIENVFHRRSEILDPPVANVDHLLVLFSLDQPKLEPFTLTRFLVEAESTGTPLTLALNKCELISEEVKNSAVSSIILSLPEFGVDKRKFRNENGSGIWKLK